MTSVTFENTYGQYLPEMSVEQFAVPTPNAQLLRFNHPLAATLGLSIGDATSAELVETFAGSGPTSNPAPRAQVYAGHQFGHFNPQLGDGRQIVLGEVLTRGGHRYDVALKGSGRTPFSRSGDGRAALGPVLREHLIGEAMHALGVPTTRALASIATGETVHRDGPQPGAIMVRVAASHLRVGTFQWAAAHGGPELVDRMVAYALDRHGPVADSPDRSNQALTLLRAVIERQAALIARWMHLGFVHGVMNTDNMTISGETIDYGPCAFIDRFDPDAVFSSIDHDGRYAYRNQPTIGQWNLARLAESLLNRIDDDPERAVTLATTELERYRDVYETAWLGLARRKLGAPTADAELAHDYLGLLARRRIDHTLGWRRLADLASGAEQRWHELLGPTDDDLRAWLQRWELVVDRSPTSVATMRATSPAYIPRNHLVEEALTAAAADDLAPFDRLLDVLSTPFDEGERDAAFAEQAPEAFNDRYVTYCGT